LTSETCFSVNVGADGAADFASDFGRSQAATAAATSVIANMTTMGQRAVPLVGFAGGHGICGVDPDGNPGGGAVFDMRRMLSLISRFVIGFEAS
jgi:hypothetical protein